MIPLNDIRLSGSIVFVYGYRAGLEEVELPWQQYGGAIAFRIKVSVHLFEDHVISHDTGLNFRYFN